MCVRENACVGGDSPSLRVSLPVSLSHSRLSRAFSFTLIKFLIYALFGSFCGPRRLQNRFSGKARQQASSAKCAKWREPERVLPALTPSFTHLTHSLPTPILGQCVCECVRTAIFK